ncbi:MAG: DUF502 domain-containing protein [Syntrophobacteria bacterium]
MFKRLRAKIRGYFLAGLLVIVPLGVTVAVITAVLRLVDGLLVIIPPKLHPHTYLPKIPGLGLVLAVVLVMITGILVKNYIGHRVVALGEYILSGIPLVRPVYAAVKQVAQAMFGDAAYAFQRAILVEYPRKGVWAIAFVTGKTYDGIQGKIDKKMINVFLPTTPNPTSGFYLVIPEEDTIPLDMNVEDAFKLLISCGVVEPGGSVPRFPFGKRQHNAKDAARSMQIGKQDASTPSTHSTGSGQADSPRSGAGQADQPGEPQKITDES